MKFDGIAFAKKIETEVKARVKQLKTKPRIVSILVGDDPASVLYTRLKQEAATRVGIEFEVVNIKSGITNTELHNTVVEMASRYDVTGLMLQLPVPHLQGSTLKDVLSSIPNEKDVDGLRYPESGIVPPVVSAVMRIMDSIQHGKSIVVVGAAGFVGSGVVLELAKQGVKCMEVERGDDMGVIKSGDVVISAVGEEGIIKPEMVKDGSIVIDVGAPRGDMTIEVYQKASVSVEVPGGVGPVTISCLMANGVKLCQTLK